MALLATVTLPDTLPAPAGVNVTLNVAFCPGVRICPVDTPLALNPGPDTLTFETVTLEFPLFGERHGIGAAAAYVDAPKIQLDAFGSQRRCGAFTVRVASLLVALPAELLTTTLNTAPLSAFVVAAVVYEADIAPLIAAPFLFHW